jgi:prepilin-type N-terminal cleavage/methylation domain-containing protein
MGTRVIKRLADLASSQLRRRGRGHQRGFTLVEVLVAVGIFSMAMSLLFDFFARGLQRSAEARSLAAAKMVALSVLAKLGAEIPLRNGETSSEGAIRWRMRIDHYGEPGDRQSWPVGAYLVSLDVRWGESDRQRLSWKTIRLGPGTEPR